MSTAIASPDTSESLLKQPKAVWAVAFASVIAFMGIGLVDPILKPIGEQLDASPAQVSLLFTSYMLVTGVAMLITGVVSSRFGAKKTLLCGLAIIIAFVLIVVMLPESPKPTHHTSLAAPFKALRHRGLLTVGITALLYNYGFFTLLAYTPFPLDTGTYSIGFIFFGWGLMLAVASVFLAPRLQRAFGTLPMMAAALLLFALDLAMMAAFTDNKTVLIVGVVLAGLFLGVNNTLITETVIISSPVERSTASAAYSFVRFSGGSAAPYLAGKLGGHSIHVPFWVGAACTLAAVFILLSGRKVLAHIDDHDPAPHSIDEAQAITVGD